MGKIDNCYQCVHYQVCALREEMENLLDKGHHKMGVGGKVVLKNSIPLPFLRLMANLCKVGER